MQEIQFDYFHGMEAEQHKCLPGSQSIVCGVQVLYKPSPAESKRFYTV